MEKRARRMEEGELRSLEMRGERDREYKKIWDGEGGRSIRRKKMSVHL